MIKTKNMNKIKNRKNIKPAKVISELIMTGLILSLFSACSDIPSYPFKSNSQAGAITCTIDDNTVIVNPVDAELPSDFMRGFDSSADTESGVSYKNIAGNDCELYETLKSFGINWVRLRVWNNPYSTKNPSVPGKSNKEVLVGQAVRAKKAGLKVLVDFHYSDYWADPGKQVIPEDWLDCSTSDQLAAKLSDYTKEVLNALKEAGVEPNMIQIGNEISSGMLKHKALDSSEIATNADDAVRGDFCSANYFKYLVAGISAARETCPSAKIMLQFTDISRNNPLNYLSNFKTAFDSAGVDYDVIGLSWYSEWSSHGTLAELGEKIAALKSGFAKDVCVVETNVHWKYEEGSAILSEQHKKNLVGADGKVYSGILTDDKGNIIASVQNQANIIRAIIEVTAQNGGCGVFEWGGEYLGAWNSMFAGSGKPLASLAVYGVQ